MLINNVFGLGVASKPVQQAYWLTERDFTMINTVKMLLTKKAYTELFMLDSHLLLLESIKRRLSVISMGEISNGLVNWDVRHHISELRELMGNLRKLRKDLFLALN